MTGKNSSGCSILGTNPRVSTFDGNEYIFNGLGDYWFLRAAQSLFDSRSLKIQIRMAPCGSASCITAVAINDNNENTAIFYYDADTGLLTAWSSQTGYASRDVNFDLQFGNYIAKISAFSNSEAVGYQLDISYQYSNSIRRFGFILGNKMGANAYAILDDLNMGSTTGLCGTFDGCSSNDYYSANQQYVNPGDSNTNIFTYFSETCNYRFSFTFQTF